MWVFPSTTPNKTELAQPAGDSPPHLQRDVTQLPYFVEVPQGVVEVLPRLVGLEHKGAVGLAVALRGPAAAGPLLLGLLLLGLLGMFRHHVTRRHRRFYTQHVYLGRSRGSGDGRKANAKSKTQDCKSVFNNCIRTTFPHVFRHRQDTQTHIQAGD